VSEYYVVDGHHRVAMARKLGQDFLDAHVVAYRLAGTAEPATAHAALQASGD
jgi:ParB-like chromosome segregation protein Spo0J